MRRLWEEDNVTHEGQFFTCHNVSITPKTCFKPSPPVWIGGRSPAAARRVGRVGDGWLVSGATTQEISDGRDIVFDRSKVRAGDRGGPHRDAVGLLHLPRPGQGCGPDPPVCHPPSPRRQLHRVQRPGRRGRGQRGNPAVRRRRGLQVRGTAPVLRRRVGGTTEHHVRGNSARFHKL